MREFDDLVALLEEDRPVIDPVFARELDQRAAAGFPRRRRFRLPQLGYLAVPAVGLAVAAFVIAGLPDGSGTTSDSSGGASSAPTAPQEVQSSAAKAAPATGTAADAAV